MQVKKNLVDIDSHDSDCTVSLRLTPIILATCFPDRMYRSRFLPVLLGLVKPDLFACEGTDSTARRHNGVEGNLADNL
jgi:hypothetical protein